MRHDWVLFLISRFVVPLYAQDNKYNHNAKCSLLKDTSNQWISTRSKFPAEIYLAHIMSTFPECGKYSASVFCHLKFPKIHWPYKNSLHKFAPPRAKSIRWVTPFVTRRIHQHVYLLLSPPVNMLLFTMIKVTLLYLFCITEPSPQNPFPPSKSELMRNDPLPWPKQLWREAKLPQPP